MQHAPLTPEEKRTLLSLAREAIRLRAETGRPPDPEDLKPDILTDRLQESSGLFVTLEKEGELRGCIGHMHSIDPLWRGVIDNALLAGWGDPRFSGLKEREVPNLKIEISVLSPLEPIDGPEEVEIGTHGLLIELEGQRGVLLPQVADRRHWTAEMFLDQVCFKAGLDRGTWRDPKAGLWRFSAEIFSEHESGLED